MTSPSPSNMKHATSSSAPSAPASSSSTSSSSRGGVQFRCALEEIRRISRLSSYQLEEIVAVWGDDDEQIERQQELKRDANEFIHSGRRSSDNYTFTSVGLCDHVGTRKEEKITAREQVWDAVWKEQENQRVAQVNTGHSNDIFKYNSALLAKACQQATYKSQQSAYEKAKELEFELFQQKEQEQEQQKVPTNGTQLNVSQQQQPIRNHPHHASSTTGKRKHGGRKTSTTSHDGGHNHHHHRRRSKSCSSGDSSTSRRRRDQSTSESSLAISKASQHSPRSI